MKITPRVPDGWFYLLDSDIDGCWTPAMTSAGYGRRLPPFWPLAVPLAHPRGERAEPGRYTAPAWVVLTLRATYSTRRPLRLRELAHLGARVSADLFAVGGLHALIAACDACDPA